MAYYYLTQSNTHAINAGESRNIVYDIPYVEPPDLRITDPDTDEPQADIELTPVGGDAHGFTARNAGDERLSIRWEAYGLVDERDLPAGTDVSELEPARPRDYPRMARVFVMRLLIVAAIVILLVALQVLRLD